MYRIFLAALAISALAVSSASAVITVDGNLSDWGTLQTGQTSSGASAISWIDGYSARLQGDRLYVAMGIGQTTPTYSVDPVTKTRSNYVASGVRSGGVNTLDRIFTEFWINADPGVASTDPVLYPYGTQFVGANNFPGIAGNHPGSDIYVGLGASPTGKWPAAAPDEPPGPDGINYWGKYHNNGVWRANCAFGTGVATPGANVNVAGSTGIMYARTDNAVEMSIPLAELQTMLYNFNTGVGLDKTMVQNGALPDPTSSVSNACPKLTGTISVGFRMGAHLEPDGSWDDGTGVKSSQTLTLSALTGDANWDGATNATDLNTVLSFYNQGGKGWTGGDFNNDGLTNATDLNSVLSFYNQTNGGLQMGSSNLSTVPEPSSIVMLASLAALFGAWVIRRR